MDVIEKLIAGHIEVRERLDFLNKLIQMSKADAFAWDDVFKISNFFKTEVIDHFHLEERVLCPVMRKVLPSDDQIILDEIEAEHKPILRLMEKFKTISEKHSKLFSKETREQFVKISKEIIEILIPHAKKEDEKLFPLVKKYFRSEDYKQLEDLYFKYLKV
jgi:hemerythrin-like domain-containing protein